MHRIQYLVIVSVAVCLVGLCGCFGTSNKKVDRVSSPSEPVRDWKVPLGENETAQHENAPGRPEHVDSTPEQGCSANDGVEQDEETGICTYLDDDGDFKPADPALVDLNMMKDLTPEEFEFNMVQSFYADVAPDDAQTLALREKADGGDDVAAETIALEYFKLPATDPRRDDAARYIKQARTLRTPEGLYRRGIVEYDDDGENADRAVGYLKQAAEMDYEPALSFLFENPVFNLQDEAKKRLVRIYEAKLDNPDTLEKMIRLYMGSMDDETSMDGIKAYVDKGLERNHPFAMFAMSMMLHMEGKWKEGHEFMLRAAEAGSDEANATLAFLYSSVNNAESFEDVDGNTHIPIPREYYGFLRDELSRSTDSVGMIDGYARRSNGQDIACGILFGYVERKSNSVTVQNDAIECLEKNMLSNRNRQACELAISYTDHVDDFDTIYNEEQRRQIGQSLLDCLNYALVTGDDYTEEGPSALSTALRIAGIYSRDNALFGISRDEVRELQYIIYAAVHHDPVAQSTLSQYYLAGKVIQENMERACYWSKQAMASSFCVDFCPASMMGISTCDSCSDAREVMEEACAGK